MTAFDLMTANRFDEMDYEGMAEKFLNKYGVTCNIVYADTVSNPWRNMATGTTHYQYDVTFKRGYKKFVVKFTDSAANYKLNKIPTAYDVLACLQKYDIGTYWDFLDEFGYDETKDSFVLFCAVRDEFENVEMLFGDCLDELREICQTKPPRLARGIFFVRNKNRVVKNNGK